jgi:medium-chain acyl-[acyl-carrier-protein] hydrolase
MTRYSYDWTIPAYDCDRRGPVSPASLMRYMIEASTRQTQALEEKGLEKQLWVLYNWDVFFHSFPPAGTSLRCETYATGFRRFYGYRRFRVTTLEGELIACADTTWIHLNAETGMPKRVSEETASAYGVIPEETMTVKGKDFSDPEKSLSFRVRKSDIDWYQHVNNCKYVDWILEMIPEDVEREYRLSRIQVVYKKETVYGGVVNSQVKRDVEEEMPTFIHRIADAETGELHTLARTFFDKMQIS